MSRFQYNFLFGVRSPNAPDGHRPDTRDVRKSRPLDVIQLRWDQLRSMVKSWAHIDEMPPAEVAALFVDQTGQNSLATYREYGFGDPVVFSHDHDLLRDESNNVIEPPTKVIRVGLVFPDGPLAVSGLIRSAAPGNPGFDVQPEEVANLNQPYFTLKGDSAIRNPHGMVAKGQMAAIDSGQVVVKPIATLPGAYFARNEHNMRAKFGADDAARSGDLITLLEGVTT